MCVSFNYHHSALQNASLLVTAILLDRTNQLTLSFHPDLGYSKVEKRYLVYAIGFVKVYPLDCDGFSAIHSLNHRAQVYE